MDEIQNELSWSFSRRRRFDDCLRQYYWQHYGSWRGWDRDSADEVRRAYLLKQMSGLDAWGGQIVHKVIEAALKDLRWGRLVSVENLKQRAREVMVRGWRESLKKDWEFDPKHRTNLFEHYYEDPAANTRSVAIRDRINTCLETFRRSDTYAELQGLGKKDWIVIEELETFAVEDIRVWVSLDCAYRADGRTIIIDWKTGARRDEHREQLELYALHAVRSWDVEPEDLVLRAVYLKDDTSVDHLVSMDDLDALEARIRDSVGRMRGVLVNVADNVAEVGSFPMTDDRRLCRRCNYRDLCDLGPLT